MERDASWRTHGLFADCRPYVPRRQPAMAALLLPDSPVSLCCKLRACTCIQATASRQRARLGRSRKVSPGNFAVLHPAPRGPGASCSVVAAGLIQEPWQRRPSFCYRHMCPHLRRIGFPVSMRIRHFSAVGYVPCTAEKISGIADGGLCPGDETAHSLQATAAARLIAPY